MASISISAGDFNIEAIAAMTAQDEGDMGSALALDKLARRMSAALSSHAIKTPMVSRQSMNWKDVQSTLKSPVDTTSDFDPTRPVAGKIIP